MARKRAPGFSWLDLEDMDQFTWATQYVKERRRSLQRYSRHLEYSKHGYRDLEIIGEDFERVIDRRGPHAAVLEKFFQDMKAAARAAKTRKKQREQGARKVTISKEAGDQLAGLASVAGASESAILEKLIQQAFVRKARTEPRLQEVPPTQEIEAALEATHPAQPQQQIPLQTNQQRPPRASSYVRRTHPENARGMDRDNAAWITNDNTPALYRLITRARLIARVTQDPHSDDAYEIRSEDTPLELNDSHLTVEGDRQPQATFNPIGAPTPPPATGSSLEANTTCEQDRSPGQAIKAKTKDHRTTPRRQGAASNRKRGRKRGRKRK